MAGWYSDTESDDEVLNLNLFARKSFGFKGFSKEKENTLKNIVQQFGATCNNFPKYVFTSIEHFNSLKETSTPLYNVTFFRDCVDANRYLNIEQYRFGTKHQEKRDFRDFEPCCNNFHNGQGACIVCDPTFKQEDNVKQNKKIKDKSNRSNEIKNVPINRRDQLRNKCTINTKSVNTSTQEKIPRKKVCWEQWECRLILDYIICNKLFFLVKSQSLYRRMISEGFMTHRTAESMRCYFRNHILKSIESYDLPQAVLRKLKRIRRSSYPNRRASNQNVFNRKRGLKRKIQQNQIKKKLKTKRGL